MSHGRRIAAGLALLLGALVLGAQAGGLLEGKAGNLLKKDKGAPAAQDDGDCAADSLARLITQDVGVDKHKSAVHKLFWRAERIHPDLRSARASEDSARSEIFAVAATAEQRKQLEELDSRIGAAEGQAQDELIAQRVAPVTGNLVSWPGRITRQLGAISRLTGAIGVLRRNNEIEERAPDPSQGWATDESF